MSDLGCIQAPSICVNNVWLKLWHQWTTVMCSPDEPHHPSPVQSVSRLHAVPAHTSVIHTYHWVSALINSHYITARKDCWMWVSKHCWEVNRQMTSLAFGTRASTQAGNTCQQGTLLLHPRLQACWVPSQLPGECYPSLRLSYCPAVAQIDCPDQPPTWPYQAYQHALDAETLRRWRLQSGHLWGLDEHGEASWCPMVT